MPEPLAYLNGRFLPASQLSVPVYDIGFVQGVTVAEQMRTFGGKIFLLERHLQRLDRSLAILGMGSQVCAAELAEVATRLAEHNHALLAPGDDLGVSLFVTPGAYAAFAPPGIAAGPTVGCHTYPAPFAAFAAKYEQGEKLAETSIAQTPNACWPAELKCRSRMHYYLADREASRRFPGARALMCDLAGRVTEASTANVLAFFKAEGLVSPRRERILPGITLQTVAELAAQNSIPFGERDLVPAELSSCDELFLCSTSPCLLPVTEWNGQAVGSGKPGPIFQTLLRAWNVLSGVDIVTQALRFSKRELS